MKTRVRETKLNKQMKSKQRSKDQINLKKDSIHQVTKNNFNKFTQEQLKIKTKEKNKKLSR